MPVITASGEEAVVTAWFVDEGGFTRAGQLIAETQAEKVAADVEAPSEGFVVNRVALNQPVPQGSPICEIAESTGTGRQADESPEATDTNAESKRVKASPAARRAAMELGVDLAVVVATGPSGRITESDVRTAAKPDAALGGLRAAIARNMRRAHAETAPVTLHTTARLGAEMPPHITATIMKVAAETLANHRHLNGYREGDVFYPGAVAHVAVAIQTDEGLVAPVVRDPAGRSVEDISAEIKDLAIRAADKTLTAEDYEGGTFTITNLGSYGIDGFTPIINLPQVAILGVGAVRQVPATDENTATANEYQMVLSLTFDHAFVDGAPAAAFLQQVAENLAAI